MGVMDFAGPLNDRLQLRIDAETKKKRSSTASSDVSPGGLKFAN